MLVTFSGNHLILISKKQINFLKKYVYIYTELRAGCLLFVGVCFQNEVKITNQNFESSLA